MGSFAILLAFLMYPVVQLLDGEVVDAVCSAHNSLQCLSIDGSAASISSSDVAATIRLVLLQK